GGGGAFPILICQLTSVARAVPGTAITSDSKNHQRRLRLMVILLSELSGKADGSVDTMPIPEECLPRLERRESAGSVPPVGSRRVPGNALPSNGRSARA